MGLFDRDTLVFISRGLIASRANPIDSKMALCVKQSSAYRRPFSLHRKFP
ncbi:hypothetical protein RRSWK_01209 [Rhodopirellula sp. SWK7]|nr:hypothetical protein RRSWK_01209 [Rhodopirellula sp. SWK7]